MLQASTYFLFLKEFYHFLTTDWSSTKFPLSEKEFNTRKERQTRYSTTFCVNISAMHRDSTPPKGIPAILALEPKLTKICSFLIPASITCCKHNFKFLNLYSVYLPLENHCLFKFVLKYVRNKYVIINNNNIYKRNTTAVFKINHRCCYFLKKHKLSYYCNLEQKLLCQLLRIESPPNIGTTIFRQFYVTK